MANASTKTPLVKSKIAAFKITPEQHRMIEQRAEKCGVKAGTWMRVIVLQAVGSRANDGFLRIREPDGSMT